MSGAQKNCHGNVKRGNGCRYSQRQLFTKLMNVNLHTDLLYDLNKQVYKVICFSAI